jgi:hypothetical protein
VSLPAILIALAGAIVVYGMRKAGVLRQPARFLVVLAFAVIVAVMIGHWIPVRPAY